MIARRLGGLTQAFQRLDAGHLISLAALLLSLGAAAVNAWFFLAGSDLRLLRPEQVMFYQARLGRMEVLNVAVPVNLVNSAVANFGDTAIEMRLAGRLSSGEVVDFGSARDSIVTVWSDEAPGAGACVLPTRCFSHGDLRFIQNPAALVDVPGSSSRQTDLAFTLAQQPCPEGRCRFFSYARSLQSLHTLREVEISVEFADDGVRRVRCSLEPFSRANLDYLVRNRILTKRLTRCREGAGLWLEDLWGAILVAGPEPATGPAAWPKKKDAWGSSPQTS